MNAFEKKRMQGMTLVEVMIAMAILSIFSITILSAVLLGRRLSEANIYENTALTVAQGYMEQIKSMEYDVVLNCLASPLTVPLPTKSISALAVGTVIEIDDVLFLDQQNSKEIMIDLRDADTANPKPVTMGYKVKPTINNLDTGGTPLKALEVELAYEFQSPETGTLRWRKGAVRFVKSYAPTF